MHNDSNSDKIQKIYEEDVPRVAVRDEVQSLTNSMMDNLFEILVDNEIVEPKDFRKMEYEARKKVAKQIREEAIEAAVQSVPQTTYEDEQKAQDVVTKQVETHKRGYKGEVSAYENIERAYKVAEAAQAAREVMKKSRDVLSESEDLLVPQHKDIENKKVIQEKAHALAVERNKAEQQSNTEKRMSDDELKMLAEVIAKAGKAKATVQQIAGVTSNGGASLVIKRPSAMKKPIMTEKEVHHVVADEDAQTDVDASPISQEKPSRDNKIENGDSERSKKIESVVIDSNSITEEAQTAGDTYSDATDEEVANGAWANQLKSQKPYMTEQFAAITPEQVTFPAAFVQKLTGKFAPIAQKDGDTPSVQIDQGIIDQKTGEIDVHKVRSGLYDPPYPPSGPRKPGNTKAVELLEDDGNTKKAPKKGAIIAIVAIVAVAVIGFAAWFGIGQYNKGVEKELYWEKVDSYAIPDGYLQPGQQADSNVLIEYVYDAKNDTEAKADEYRAFVEYMSLGGHNKEDMSALVERTGSFESAVDELGNVKEAETATNGKVVKIVLHLPIEAKGSVEGDKANATKTPEGTITKAQNENVKQPAPSEPTK